MAFEDKFRMSVHAVITDKDKKVLLLKANYGNKGWGLPGGAVDPGETIHEALSRECFEEIGTKVIIKELTGVYYHRKYDSQVIIFKCELPIDVKIRLSDEHTELNYESLDRMSEIQRIRVKDCLEYDGLARSRKF